MFYEITAQHPYIRELEKNWLLIKHELNLLSQHKYKTYEHSKDGGWKIIMLYMLGETREEYLSLCPETMRLLKNIPGITTALVSRLDAHSRIHPHTDKGVWLEQQQRYITYNDENLIRCHLGLSVPRTNENLDCAIKIGGEVSVWREGQCMMFDCTVEHEAWNNTDENRTVLIVDFMKEGKIFQETNDIQIYKQHLLDVYM